MSKPKTWNLKIYNCPHCQAVIDIKQRSVISERNLIKLVYNDIDNHLKVCDKRKEPKSIFIYIVEETILSAEYNTSVANFNPAKIVF